MQYSLKFPLVASYLPEDYIVTQANDIAHRIITSEQQPWGVEPYPNHLLLIGPKSSGKTHLAHLWSQKYGAAFGFNVITHGCIIDDIELYHERDLLHCFNIMHENKRPILMTTSGANHFTILDLDSRMNSLRSVRLTTPDEEMIRVLLMRNFSARSLLVSNEVIDYLSSRIKRDFATIRLFIEQLDLYALDTRRKITIPLIRELLNNLNE